MPPTKSVMSEAAERALVAGMAPDDAAVELETEMIQVSLQQNGGNQCRAARELRMHRGGRRTSSSSIKLRNRGRRRLPMNGASIRAELRDGMVRRRSEGPLPGSSAGLCARVGSGNLYVQERAPGCEARSGNGEAQSPADRRPPQTGSAR